MKLRACLLIAVAACILQDGLTGQNAAPRVNAPPKDSLLTLPNVGNVFLGSTLGWTLGLAAGVAVGYWIQPESPDDSFIGAGEWWVGGWIGSSVGAAAGAHVANRGHGNIVVSTLGTFVLTPLALVVAIPVADGPGVLLVPAAQIGVSIAIERGTSKRRAK